MQDKPISAPTIPTNTPAIYLEVIEEDTLDSSLDKESLYDSLDEEMKIREENNDDEGMIVGVENKEVIIINEEGKTDIPGKINILGKMVILNTKMTLDEPKKMKKVDKPIKNATIDKKQPLKKKLKQLTMD